MGSVEPAQTLTSPDSHMYLSLESSAGKARLVSIVGTLVVYSGIPQTPDLPSLSQGFNPQLAQLHRKISIPLP